jgi:hypothetical protein
MTSKPAREGSNLMTLLDPVATPRHRSIYPGELAVVLGRDPGTAGCPAGVTISLLSADFPYSTWIPGKPGVCELAAKDGAPVMIRAGRPVPGGGMEIADRLTLARFTGIPLAHELLDCIRVLQARLGPRDTQVTRTLRFRDLTRFNDLICGLSGRYLGVSGADALLSLLADVSQHHEAQRDWYAANGPDDGESLAGYTAEAAAFGSLASAWLRTARAQLALAGQPAARS